jgi:hypothetical protein
MVFDHLFEHCRAFFYLRSRTGKRAVIAGEVDPTERSNLIPMPYIRLNIIDIFRLLEVVDKGID